MSNSYFNLTCKQVLRKQEGGVVGQEYFWKQDRSVLQQLPCVQTLQNTYSLTVFTSGKKHISSYSSTRMKDYFSNISTT